jgi:hypothetical protein
LADGGKVLVQAARAGLAANRRELCKLLWQLYDLIRLTCHSFCPSCSASPQRRAGLCYSAAESNARRHEVFRRGGAREVLPEEEIMGVRYCLIPLTAIVTIAFATEASAQALVREQKVITSAGAGIAPRRSVDRNTRLSP